ncbi:MAG: hypothetical protein CMJ23_05525 [Phycisphaerae bacterium]|nr:hypothetical protein [Phycisphaerae bacterium]
MPLIKNNRARELVNGAVVMNLGDVRKEANDLLDAARRDASEIVEAARLEAERLSAGAAERGYEDGRKRGEEEGRIAGREEGALEGAGVAEAAIAERLGGIADGWTQALDAFLAGREVLREETRRDLLRLSIAIAERVLGRLPAHDPGLVVGQVEAAMEMLTGATRLRIQVHPDDLPIIETHFREAKSTMLSAAEADIDFGTDEAIVRGGCVVSAGDGEVDARLDAQMSRIVEGLFPELLESPEPPTAVEIRDPDVPGTSEAPASDRTPPVVSPGQSSDGSSDGASNRPSAVDSWDDIVPAADDPASDETEKTSE